MYDLFLRHPFMSAAGVAACDARAVVDAMCQFEQALARVQEAAGHLAPGTSEALFTHLHADAFDIEALAAATADGGNVAIGFVAQARARLPAPLDDAFHVGATSQDVLDSALMLLFKPRLRRCLELLDRACEGGAAPMDRHTATPMIGRTLTQQALPITFGAKIARWLAGLMQARDRLEHIADHGLPVQFGGPVGAHHAFADDGMALMAALAEALDLNCPLLPWHTDRQPLLALVDAVGAAAVAAEKIATDVAMMAQTEVGEVAEPAATGAGGSSSMPHKRNPVGSVRIRAAARGIHAAVGLIHGAGAQAHERAFGQWHAEWAPAVDAVLLLEGALETLADLLGGLRVNAAAMRENLALSAAAVLRAPAVALLGETMSRERAEALVDRAGGHARDARRDYAEALLAIPEVAEAVDAQRLRAALDPGAHVGTSAAQVERVRAALARRRAVRDDPGTA